MSDSLGRRIDTAERADRRREVDVRRERLRLRTRLRHARHAHVARHVHDLLVDERALRAQPVRPAHVAVIGGEDHDRVVVGAGLLERAEHRAERLVGHLLQLHVVVEVAQPRPLVARDRCIPTARAAGPSAIAVASRACRAGRHRSSRAACRTPRRRRCRRSAARRLLSTSPTRGPGGRGAPPRDGAGRSRAGRSGTTSRRAGSRARR